MTSTHSYVVLEVSSVAYREIKKALEKAGYEGQFHEDDEHGTLLDMQGIAIAESKPQPPIPKVCKHNKSTSLFCIDCENDTVRKGRS